jgi:thiol peroxidase
MVSNDLTEVNLYSFKDKHILLNIFPSLDTDICARSVREFNKEAVDLGGVAIINLSMDLPFAQKRFCLSEGIKNVQTYSLFRSDFFKYYPLDFVDGPLKGLCSRVVMIINDKHEITYVEEVLEVSNEPNYREALRALKT